MNIKAATWDNNGTIITGEDLFALNNFTEYRVYMQTTDSSTNGIAYPTLMRPITVNFCRSIYPINIRHYDRTWLVYKSKLGGWSWLSFNMKSSRKQDTSKVKYNRRLAYNETYKQRGTTVISNSVSNIYTLNSNWVSTDEYKFFEDLFASPQVFMYRGYINGEANITDPFLPVSVKTTSTPIYQPNNDKLFNYTIEVESANSSTRQRK